MQSATAPIQFLKLFFMAAEYTKSTRRKEEVNCVPAATNASRMILDAGKRPCLTSPVGSRRYSVATKRATAAATPASSIASTSPRPLRKRINAFHDESSHTVISASHVLLGS